MPLAFQRSHPVPAPSPGHLTVITGCMFSGKTERLIAALREAERAGLPVAAFKHSADQRYGRPGLVSHSRQTHPAVSVTRAFEMLSGVGPARVVAIDEAQFFAEELLDVCMDLRRGGRRVLVAGLDRDVWGRPFAPVPDLSARADHTIRTTAVCSSCGRPATRTHRREPIRANQSLVGGPEAYEPRCTRCFRPPTVLAAAPATA